VKRAIALAVLATACAEHPAYTVGIATGAISFGACEVDSVAIGDCALIGAITGVVLGVVTAVIYHYTDSSAHELKMDESLGSGGVVQLHTFTPPPPVPLDAGSGSAVLLDVGSGSATVIVPGPVDVGSGSATVIVPSDAGI
jgi:hypothetical protein